MSQFVITKDGVGRSDFCVSELTRHMQSDVFLCGMLLMLLVSQII